MRRVGLLINAGIEYRNFLLSGLASQLRGDGLEVVVLQRGFKSPALEQYLQDQGLAATQLPLPWFRGRRTRQEEWFSSCRQARKRLQRIGNFHNYRAVESKRNFDFAKGNPLSYQALLSWVTKSLPTAYYHQPIRDLLQEQQITDLVMSGYSSIGNMRFTYNASALGIRTWILVNSWKDLFINDFVPFQPTSLFVWSEAMKSDFLSLNGHIDAERVVPSGNPIFDRLFQYRSHHPLNTYSKKYGFDPQRPLFVYSLINPDAYELEHEIIRLIDRVIEENFTENQRPFLILRRNPFEVREETPALYRNLRNCAVADQLWERDHELDVSVQPLAGEIEWTDLLYHARGIVNVASTVAVESLLLGKPVLNIGFGPDGDPEPPCLRYAEAPFYQPLLERPDVFLATTIREFQDQLSAVVSRSPVEIQAPDVAGRFDGKSLSRLSSLVSGKTKPKH